MTYMKEKEGLCVHLYIYTWSWNQLFILSGFNFCPSGRYYYFFLLTIQRVVTLLKCWVFCFLFLNFSLFNAALKHFLVDFFVNPCCLSGGALERQQDISYLWKCVCTWKEGLSFTFPCHAPDLRHRHSGEEKK